MNLVSILHAIIVTIPGNESLDSFFNRVAGLNPTSEARSSTSAYVAEHHPVAGRKFFSAFRPRHSSRTLINWSSSTDCCCRYVNTVWCKTRPRIGAFTTPCFIDLRQVEHDPEHSSAMSSTKVKSRCIRPLLNHRSACPPESLW